MDNEKYLNAALIMKEFDIMECYENSDGSFSFKPEEKITKEEFVYLLMTTMGAKNVPTLDKTRFADNDEISPQYRGYIEGALSLGIINGENKTDGLYFNPKKEITLAEAATIINNVIGAKTNNKQTFKDDENIPSYAKEDIYALTEAGIINGEGGEIKANNPLSRSQTAQILLSLLKYKGKIN
ncbi:MAG: S-layer homology domain-containing protein [Clostridia bacterium]|nr:S-layer homology domain-containing protein [Clostridia bacterium]